MARKGAGRELLAELRFLQVRKGGQEYNIDMLFVGGDFSRMMDALFKKC